MGDEVDSVTHKREITNDSDIRIVGLNEGIPGSPRGKNDYVRLGKLSFAGDGNGEGGRRS